MHRWAVWLLDGVALLTITAGCGGTRNAPVSTAECSEGAHRCGGDTWQACRGSAWVDEQRCTTRCDAERGCLACLPGQDYCVGGTITSCRDDGTPGDPKRTCPGSACSGGVCVDPCTEAAARRSYLGCSYWPTVTANAVVPEVAHFAVAVANPNDTPADILVTRPGGFARNAQVLPGRLTVLELDWVDELRAATRSALVGGGAYRLDSSLPVTVYQFNPLEYQVEPCGNVASCPTWSNDASLLLPQHALSSHYLVVARPTLLFLDRIGGAFPMQTWKGGYPGFVSVVGTAEGTTRVTVRFTVETAAGKGIVGTYGAGQQATFELAQNDVLQLFGNVPDKCTPAFTENVGDNPVSPETMAYCDLPDTDLTGTEITSDRPVAVFSGHACAFVPYSRWACDHLEEQLLPLESWGKRYAVAKIQRQPPIIPDLVRVISGAGQNRIEFDPPSVHAPVMLDRGDYLELPVTEDFVASGSAAFLVVQFMVGQDYFGIGTGNDQPGDPAMSTQVPVEQYRDSYIFLTPDTYQLNYVNVTAPDGVDVVLDGAPLPVKLQPFGSGAFRAGRVPVTAGTHRMEATRPFGIQVYGLAPYTSYMYPGGLDVRQINVQ